MVGNNVPTGEITISGPKGDEHICTMDGNEDNLANGNLIAAAPAMYEALGHVWEVLGKSMDLYTSALVENALAQAEGKSPLQRH
jgi:hypothetical protein